MGSRTEVAEIPFTAFSSRKKADQVSGRLMVRRIPDLTSKAIPLGYLQPAQSVADAFLLLASPLSSYMTGSTLLVDGGCSLYPMDDAQQEQ